MQGCTQACSCCARDLPCGTRTTYLGSLLGGSLPQRTVRAEGAACASAAWPVLTAAPWNSSMLTASLRSQWSLVTESPSPSSFSSSLHHPQR